MSVMIILELVQNDEKYVVYRYLVEGSKDQAGELSLDKESGQIVSKKADGDYGKYIGYSTLAVEEFAKNSDFPKEHVIAFG